MVLWVSEWSCSVMSDSLQPHGLQPTRFLCPWDSPGKNTGVDCHFLLQGIFPTQGSNRGLPHCRQTLYPLSYQGSICNFKSMFTFALILMVWLTSLGMITSRSIHVAANGIVLFFVAEWYSIVCVCVCVCMCVYHIFFNHSSVKGHLVYFHVLAINAFLFLGILFWQNRIIQYTKLVSYWISLGLMYKFVFVC